MERMKTFLLYVLGILGFMFLSYVLENGLISSMYETMRGEIIPSGDVIIQDDVGKASNVNGFMSFNILNNSSNNIENQYIKIDLYSKQGLYAASKYVPIEDMAPESSKNYQIKFKGTEIRYYKISLVSEIPDKSNIINILGWEIDLTDVFGMDLSNAKIFGVKLSDLFNWQNIKGAGSNAWTWFATLAKSVPWWGYAIATGIIIWYMPKGYLFGIFPF